MVEVLPLPRSLSLPNSDRKMNFSRPSDVWFLLLIWKNFLQGDFCGLFPVRKAVYGKTFLYIGLSSSIR